MPNDLSSELVMAQSQANESYFTKRSAGGNSSVTSYETANIVIQNIKFEITSAESKHSGLSQLVGVTQYH